MSQPHKIDDWHEARVDLEQRIADERHRLRKLGLVGPGIDRRLREDFDEQLALLRAYFDVWED